MNKTEREKWEREAWECHINSHSMKMEIAAVRKRFPLLPLEQAIKTANVKWHIKYNVMF